MDRVQVSGKETRKIYYRNDPVKYDLDLTIQIPLVFKRFKGNILGLESFGRPVYIKNARRISPTDLFDIIATLSK